MPTPRDTKPLSAEERQRVSDELSAIRERQEAETAAAPAAGSAPAAAAAPPPGTAPAKKSTVR